MQAHKAFDATPAKSTAGRSERATVVLPKRYGVASKQEKAEGFRFIGTGVSGGEEGALKGPSIMPGGHPEAWPFVKDILLVQRVKIS